MSAGGDLDANEVLGIVEAAPAALVDAVQPVPSDDGDQRVAVADPLRENFDEVIPPTQCR